MKKLMIAAAAVAFGVSAYADVVQWFDGGIAENWPTAASMTGGAWSNTDGATYAGGALEVKASVDTPLTFTANPKKVVGEDADSVKVTSTITFTPYAELPEVPEGAKAGVILVQDGEVLKYYGLNSPNEGDPMAWQYLEIDAEESGVPVAVALEFGDNHEVKYTIGESAGTFYWESEDESIGTVCYAGDGTVTALAGTYEGEAPVTYEAKIGDQNYATLGEALEAAEAGDTIEILMDITTDAAAAYKINKDIDIDFATYTVTKTVANDYTFDIANGATVTFKGTTGGVTQTQTAKNPKSPAAAIRNKGNLTIDGGVYVSDVCIIKNDEDPGAGVLTVNGGTFDVVEADPGLAQIPMALMNWATATINGGTWNGTIGTRSSDNNGVSKFGTTEITAALDGDVSYLLFVGYPGDTTYENMPKIKGVALADVTLGQVASITDALELVEDGEWVTVQKKSAVEPVAPGDYKDTAADATEAAAKVLIIDNNKASYIKAPGDVETTDEYLALFGAKATENGTGGYDITVGLTPAAEVLLQEAANAAVATALDDGKFDAIPGLYYTFVGGTALDAITTPGTKTLADTNKVTVPKPELGETDKAFYQLKIEIK